MPLAFPPVAVFAAAWVALMGIVAARVLRRGRERPDRPATGLTLAAIAMLAIAPCTYAVLSFVDDDPPVFASLVQLGIAALLFAGAARARREQRDPDGTASTLAYPEKSALLVLAALVFVYGDYFLKTWRADIDVVIPAFVGSVILLVAILIAGHIVLALLHSPQDEVDAAADERDRRVRRLGIRNAHYALLAAYWSIPVLVLLPLPTVTVLNLWFGFLVVSEIVYCASVVAYYRLGAD